MPLMLCAFGRMHLACESTRAALLLCYAYHVLRIGPFFMNFAYVYSVCHKEGHASAARTGLFKAPFDRSGPFRYIFNWWIGLFFGVLPSTFAVGHSINHHKYNNGPGDILSTCDKPRDESLPSWRARSAHTATQVGVPEAHATASRAYTWSPTSAPASRTASTSATRRASSWQSS